MTTRLGIRIASRILAGLLALSLLLVLAAWGLMRGSLPQLDGDIALQGLAAPLSIGRDDLGTVVLQGRTRLDLARGLGFVHAQERFFEMDLSRRSAAGELAALFGAAALEGDKRQRQHRLRARLTERLATLPEAERASLEAYAAGVNAGLAALAVRPWQYVLLRSGPEPWQAVDSLLTIGAMYGMLQRTPGESAFYKSLLRERAGDALFDWLNPRGGAWDAALDASELSASAMPGPGQLDLRHAPVATRTNEPGPQWDPAPSMIGSNNWAVSGSRTADGRAILANDMHLGLGVPNIWFRAQFLIGEGPAAVRAAGVTLPGSPAIVVGSNGSVAWGFTNATGNWLDWIKLPAEVPAGRIRVFRETIAVKGGEARTVEVREFDGWPILRERDGQRYALRWIGLQPEAYNVKLDEMLQARNADEAVLIAQQAGTPHQNILIADRDGNIVWTIAGRLWSERSMAGNFARFQAADAVPPGWLSPAEYPIVRNPASGQLWTANNRQMGGDAADVLGNGDLDLGTRAGQIRDRLSAIAVHDEATLGAIQFDNEARLARTWAQRIERLVASSPQHAEVANVLRQWNGRADADQAGYRLVKAVRRKTLDTLWKAWAMPFLGKRDDAKPGERRYQSNGRQFEYSATQALDQRPAHLLPPGHASWEALVLAQVDAAVKELTDDGKRPLERATWGAENSARIQHVLSHAIPVLARLIDMPSVPQSGGDSFMPHIAYRDFGQSERMVVSPGREDAASLSMPGGQSGHPLSPYYGAGHDAFMRGDRTPLLAGPVRHRINASPAP